MPEEVREAMHLRASGTVRAHSLEVERAMFHAVLDGIDHLWHHGPSEVVDASL